MSLRNLSKHTVVTLAFAASALVASATEAGAANDNLSGAIAPTDVSYASSGPCHPVRGACLSYANRVAAEAKAYSAAQGNAQTVPNDRTWVSNPCHPAYAPSWNACTKSTRFVLTTDPA